MPEAAAMADAITTRKLLRRTEIAGNTSGMRLSTMLFPENEDRLSAKFHEGYQTEMVRAAAQRPHELESDEKEQMKYCATIGSSQIPLPRKVSKQVKELLPHGFTLLDHLRADIETSQSWIVPEAEVFQSLSTDQYVTKSLQQSIETREIILSKSTDRVEANNFIKWVAEKQSGNFDKHKSNLCAFNTWDILIPKAQYSKLLNHKEDSVTVQAIDSDETTHDSMEPFTARFTIGDGCTWVASYIFDIDADKQSKPDHFQFNLAPLPSHIIRVLEKMPTCAGINAQAQRDRIRYQLRHVYKTAVRLPATVEINALGALVGYNVPQDDLFTWNLVTTGTILNTLSIGGDNGWSTNWDILSPWFKVLATAELRATHTVLSVLQAILMRNFFPDPVSISAALAVPPREAYEYLLYVITESLKEVKVSRYQQTSQRLDRYQLAKSLYQTEDNREDIKLLIGMIPDWPNITSGGARHIHAVTQKAVNQYMHIKNLAYAHTSVGADLSRDITDMIFEEITFGREGSGSLFAPAYYQRLCCDPEFQDDIFVIADPGGNYWLDNNTLRKQTQEHNRTIKFGILEYARLTPAWIPGILKALNEINPNDRNYSYITSKRAMVEMIRNMYYCLYGQVPVTVPFMQRRIKAINKGILEREECARANDQRKLRHTKDERVRSILEEKIANRNARIDIMKAEELSLSLPTTAIIETRRENRAFSAVPGDNYKRNQKIRARAQRRKQERIANGTYLYKDSRCSPDSGDLRNHLERRRY